MADYLNPQDLANAKVDAKTLGEAVNDKKIVKPRYGDSYKSIPLLSADGDLAIAELKKAIDIAAAAGAGANGWVDKLVMTWGGRTQESKNKDCITTRDYGAICDGTYHPLSEFFEALQDAQSKYPSVTSLDQSIDDVALQYALDTADISVAVVVVGKHCTYALNERKADPVIVNTVERRKLIFEGVLVAGNDVKRFMSCDAAYCTLKVNADGGGTSLNSILRVTKPHCVIAYGCYENIYSKEFGAGAISLTGEAYGALVYRNTVRNLNARGDGIIGNGLGMCRAVAVDFTDPVFETVIAYNTFDNITGDEGDAVTIVSKSVTGSTTDSKVLIRNNSIGNCNRRMIKAQADCVRVISNTFYMNDPSIVPTDVRNCVDLVTGSGHIVDNNDFDKVIDFTQISVHQTSSSTTQNRIKITRNRFLGLDTLLHTRASVSLASPDAQVFVVKGNEFTVGANVAVAVGGASRVLLKDNEFDCIDAADAAVVTITSKVSKCVVVDNTLIQGSRQAFLLDAATGTVFKDNINMTNTPQVRHVTANLRSHLIGNIAFASGVTVGSNYKGSYIYDNIRLDGVANPYAPVLYTSSQNPSAVLGDADVNIGQVVLAPWSKAGDSLGFVAKASGKASEVDWLRFGTL